MSTRRIASLPLLLAVSIIAIPLSAWNSLNTTTALSVSSHSVTVGTAVAFTATVTDQNSVAVTSGQVRFCDATATYCQDAAVLGTAQLTSTGMAVVKLRLGSGGHSVKAVFAGSSADGGSVSTAQTVTVSGQLPSAAGLALSGVVGNYMLTATVMGGGSVAPTGSVTFEDASNNNASVAMASLNSQTAALGFPLSTYAAGNYPYAVAVGDFNGDGKPDLVVANEGDGTVSVLLGNGDGSFQAQQTYNVGNCPYGIAVGDFNGDGKPDIVVVNECDNTASVLLGNGDGTFQAQQTFAVGNYAVSVAVGDFNGDGNPDLVAANNGDGTVSVLLGNGDGTFQAQQTYAVGHSPQSVAAGDFNGDGKADLVVANSSDNTVSVLLGNGDGTFQSQQTYAAGYYPSSVAVADFNGDGKPDVVVANAGDFTVTVLLGNGDGTFQVEQSYNAGGCAYSIAVGDFNGDGKSDVVTANECNDTVSVLLGKGDGTLQPQQTYSAGSTPYFVAVGDFNGDGSTDVVAADAYSNAVSVLLNLWSVQATASNVTALGGPATHAVFAAYGGDTNYAASSSSTVNLQNGILTALTLTSGSGSSVAAGTSDTLTATLVPNTYNSTTATGTVTFYDGTTQIGSPVSLNGSGQAVVTTAALSAGTHNFSAIYAGDNTFSGATGSVLVYAILPTTTTLNVSSNNVAVGTVVVFTATVTDQNSAAVTSGQVKFCDATATYCEDAALLGTAQLTSAGTAVVNLRLGLGSHSVKAVFGGTSVDGSSVSTAQTVTVSGQLPSAAALAVNGGVGNYTLTATVTGRRECGSDGRRDV